ncbi:BTH_I0359 family protein [Comamonas kerstersii]|uniref:BTH_I0359 family protein n=1 Tax=Comamonas kerstersii TaxID=225992 RepID=UPI00345D172E
MKMLYDSDSFVVLHLRPDLGMPTEVPRADGMGSVPALPRHGFEIVDKRSGKEVYLDGSWAELFQQVIQGWQREAPDEDEVEATLERYAQLAQNPVLIH